MTKLIFNPLVAKYLLNKGYRIVGIKKNDIDGSDVYEFTTDLKFSKVLENYTRSKRHQDNPIVSTYDTKLVFKRNTAMVLLEIGYKIVDLKKNKYADEEVYVFEVNTDDFHTLSLLERLIDIVGR